MRSRYEMIDPDGVYFLTANLMEWIPVFTSRDTFDMVINAFEHYRKNNGLRLYAYVVMDNHLHLIAQVPELGKIMQNFKSYTARKLINLAESSGRKWLLNQWSFFKRHHKHESVYQIWQEGLHPQLIQGESMLIQKMEYIHTNPVRRGFVDAPEHYRYSSARNHLLEDHSVLAMDDLPGWQ